MSPSPFRLLCHPSSSLLRLSTPLQSHFTCLSTHIFTYLYVPIRLPSILLTFVQSLGFLNNQDFVFFVCVCLCLCVCLSECVFCLFLARLISSLACIIIDISTAVHHPDHPSSFSRFSALDQKPWTRSRFWSAIGRPRKLFPSLST